MKKINKVLLIDDNPDDNEFHEIVISETGVDVKVHCLTDSRQALACWLDCCASENNNGHTVPDIVFLDINMPALNGFELLEKVRETPDPFNRKKELKVFMLTTSSHLNDYISATENHGDLVLGYLSKPLTGKVFLEILEQYF